MLALLDGAVGWLVACGLSGQWGAEPFSADPSMAPKVGRYAAAGQLRVAEEAGRVVGAIALGDVPAYAPEVDEPEIYLHCFVTDRARAGTGIGALLLELAFAEAARHGIGLVRVDCWAGGDGRLVDYYRQAGFTPLRRLDVAGWPAQLFERRFD